MYFQQVFVYSHYATLSSYFILSFLFLFVCLPYSVNWMGSISVSVNRNITGRFIVYRLLIVLSMQIRLYCAFRKKNTIYDKILIFSQVEWLHSLWISVQEQYPTQPFYGPFSDTTWVSRCQKRASGLYGAREDQKRQTHWPSSWVPLHPD